MSLSVIIPSEHYVGFQFRTNDIYPLAFSTPNGDDQASQKRKATVDKWANSSQVKVPAKVFKNVPMVGFEISKSVRHSFSRSNVERWRIIDPRGFELEISNTNMSLIIESCIIDNGEIIDSCVWAREGQENVLIPTSSDEYKDATKNTDRVNKKISFKDVNLGDYVTFKNGNKGRYMGKYYKHTVYINDSEDLIKCSKNKVFVFEDISGKTCEHYSTVHVSTIDKSSPISEIDAEKRINDILQLRVERYRYHDSVAAYTSKATSLSDWNVHETEFSNVSDIKNSNHYQTIIKFNGDVMCAELYYLRNQTNFRSSIAVTYIEASAYNSNYTIKPVMERATGYYNNNSVIKKSATIDIVAIPQYQLFGLEYTTITSLGNSLKIYL